jgi:hypothetical protein
MLLKVKDAETVKRSSKRKKNEYCQCQEPKKKKKDKESLNIVVAQISNQNRGGATTCRHDQRLQRSL